MYVFKPSNTEYQRHIDTKSVLYTYTTKHQKPFNGSRERESRCFVAFAVSDAAVAAVAVVTLPLMLPNALFPWMENRIQDRTQREIKLKRAMMHTERKRETQRTTEHQRKYRTFIVCLTFVCYVFIAVFNSFGISGVHNKLKVSRCLASLFFCVPFVSFLFSFVFLLCSMCVCVYFSVSF